jgi:hypothetical protein
VAGAPRRARPPADLSSCGSRPWRRMGPGMAGSEVCTSVPLLGIRGIPTRNTGRTSSSTSGQAFTASPPRGRTAKNWNRPSSKSRSYLSKGVRYLFTELRSFGTC